MGESERFAHFIVFQQHLCQLLYHCPFFLCYCIRYALSSVYVSSFAIRTIVDMTLEWKRACWSVSSLSLTVIASVSSAVNGIPHSVAITSEWRPVRIDGSVSSYLNTRPRFSISHWLSFATSLTALAI